MEGVKVLFLDIETAPILGWAWEKYDTTLVGAYRDWTILSVAYKWAGDEVECRTIPRPKSLTEFIQNKDNDKELVRTVWGLLDKCDIAVAHNGDRFDIRKLNSRFIYYHLGPPSPYRTVDTKKASSRVSANTSNKLDDLGQKYGLGKKLEHEGFDLWVKCMSGDKEAWENMVAYNKQDVILLESLHDYLLPWIPNYPNVAMYVDRPACPHCQSHHLQKRGLQINKTTKRIKYHCQTCGSWCQGVSVPREVRPSVSI